EAVIKKLQSSGRLLIVDEAENLSTRSLELLRRLHDLAGIGLVLVGTPRLLSNLKGRHGELEQLYSRVTLHWDLGDSVPREELDAIARATLPELADKAKLRGKIIEKAGGSPRRLFKILSNMYRMSYLNARDDGEILPMDEALLERVEMVLIRN
uniref:AAA family ATPase n=1 Tax=Eikenella corrodens TaxID=539 RepID=UPI00129A9791